MGGGRGAELSEFYTHKIGKMAGRRKFGIVDEILAPSQNPQVTGLDALIYQVFLLYILICQTPVAGLLTGPSGVQYLC